MAKDIVSQVGSGTKQMLQNVNTVRDVAQIMGALEGYTALVNSDTAGMSDSLQDDDIVTFTKAVKGGC